MGGRLAGGRGTDLRAGREGCPRSATWRAWTCSTSTRTSWPARPDTVAGLTRLTLVNLAVNRLTARPTALGTLPSLSHLIASYNQLSGDVTAVFQPLSQRAVFAEVRLEGNACLTAADPNLAAWLTERDPLWNAAC